MCVCRKGSTCVIITSAHNKGNHPDDLSAADRYNSIIIRAVVVLVVYSIIKVVVYMRYKEATRRQVDSCRDRICVVRDWVNAGVFITAENAKLRRPPDPEAGIYILLCYIYDLINYFYPRPLSISNRPYTRGLMVTEHTTHAHLRYCISII